MVNRYAPWRYVLLFLIIAIGVIYATPNLYGEDPALQISHRVNLADQAELNNIKSMLETEGIDYQSIELDGNNVLVRFASEDAQLKAATLVREALYVSDRRYVIALNLAPATPEWLTSLNALPMYLGLDLRGGVHFLMPCHSTPFYSHVHADVPMSFLDCTPPQAGGLAAVANESNRLHARPQAFVGDWLRTRSGACAIRITSR